ncbi:MAG: hypothetical protein AAFR38_06025 [Planctomycetota bacterium]
MGLSTGLAGAQLADFADWRLVEDPADPSFSAVVNGPEARLLASNAMPGVVPAGTDIGLQSVDGFTVASSTAGFAFSPGASFELAIDYQATFAAATGGLSFGFGIGEDLAGVNSAGVLLVTQLGLPAAVPFIGPVGGAAVVNDEIEAFFVQPAVSAAPATLAGTFYVSYDAVSGDLVVGWGALGSVAPTSVATIPAASAVGAWTGVDLLATFFIRSDQVEAPIVGVVSTPWSGGTGEVRFDNLRLVSGPVKWLGCGVDLVPDGALDGQDLLVAVQATASGNPSFDLDQSTSTDVFDLIEFLRRFDAGCG